MFAKALSYAYKIFLIAFARATVNLWKKMESSAQQRDEIVGALDKCDNPIIDPPTAT